MKELILCIDAGTTTLRTLLVRADGTLVQSASRRIESCYPTAGRVEQDANAIWAATLLLISECLARAHVTASDIASLGITAQRASIVLWERGSGRAVHPMVVWSDLRGLQRSAELMAAGFLCAPQMASAKLEAVFAEVATASMGSTAKPDLLWGNIESYLIYRLTAGGAHITDASHYWPMGYLDLSTLAVNQQLIDYQQLNPESFPTLVDSWGELALCDRSILGHAIPINAVIADQQSALFAHDGLIPGCCKVTYGTSACLDISTGHELQLIAESVVPFVHYQHQGETGFCVEGMVNTAGTCIDWLIDNLHLARSHRELFDLAGSVTSSEGVWVLPALAGLGAPHGDGETRLRMGGMSRGTDRRHVARATLEGICFRVREIFDAIYKTGGLSPPEVIGVDGGLARSDLLIQIQADCLNLPIVRHAATEATALGAAACAAMGAGLIDRQGLAGFSRNERRFDPGPDAVTLAATYDEWRVRVHAGRLQG